MPRPFLSFLVFGNARQPTYVGKTSAGDQTFSCESCHFQNSATDPTCSFFNGCANFDIFTPGSRVIVRHYTYNGFAISITWANDIDFENLTLRTGPGVGIGAHDGGGYRGFRLANSHITRGPERLISTASDVLDLTMQADVIVENNDIGYQGDDSIAVSPTVFSVATANETAIRSRSWVRVIPTRWMSPFLAMRWLSSTPTSSIRAPRASRLRITWFAAHRF